MTAVLGDFRMVATAPVQSSFSPSRGAAAAPAVTMGTGGSPPLGAPNSSPSPGTAAGKIFVGGLSWETNEDGLRAYFGQFGQVVDCVIMRDRHTGHPRGFGFVTYVDEAVAARVSLEKHELDGRSVEAKMAVPRGECVPPSAKIQARATKKVFVGGLPANCGDAEFQDYFGEFGHIAEAQVMYDHQTGNSRGFGFVTFTSEHTVERVVEMDHHEIMGKFVEVKRAEPKQVLEARRTRDPSRESSNTPPVPSSYPPRASARVLPRSTYPPAHFPSLSSSPPQQSPIFNSSLYPTFSTVSPTSSATWGQPTTPKSARDWTGQGYLEKTSGYSPDLADRMCAAAYGETAATGILAFGLPRTPTLRVERRFHPYR